MEDSDCLKSKLSAGDADAWRLLYDRHAAMMYRTALRMLARSADAEDAVQEVFAAVAKNRRRLVHVRDLRAYLFTALHHAAAGVARRRRSRATVALEADVPCSEPPAADAAGDDAERLWRLAERLPFEQREVLAMKTQGGLTFAQIAAALEISPNTAASRYRYAIQRLHEMMGHKP